MDLLNPVALLTQLTESLPADGARHARHFYTQRHIPCSRKNGPLGQSNINGGMLGSVCTLVGPAQGMGQFPRTTYTRDCRGHIVRFFSDVERYFVKIYHTNIS